MLQTALIFQSHMILQRGKPIAVWGTARPGAEVRVTLQGQAQITTAKSDGAWRAVCGPFAASTAETMTVSADGETLTFTDVQIGEVWLAGGQSNMEFHMYFDLDAPAEKTEAHEDIRFFDYPEVSYPGQIDEAPFREQYGFWRKATPEELDRFSAVGYYFAREIQEKLGVPVGIVGCNWGGTPASAWMDRESIAAGGGQPYLDEYDEAVKGLDLEKYDADFRANPTSFRVDLLGDPVSNALMLSSTFEEAMGKLRDMGIEFNFDPAAAMPQIGPKYPQRPAGLYESMLLPLVPYGVRGFLWYQGETDGDMHPECYATLFPAMIACWRRLWGEELPFLFVQLAPFTKWLEITSSSYHIIRAAQQHTADTVPGAYMAVTSDAGQEFDIHPKRKKPVGHRLALQALRHVYGEETLLTEAPKLEGIAVAEGKVTLTFANAGAGLTFAGQTPYGEPLAEDRFSGLTLSQNGKALDAAQLRAEAYGDQVILTSPEIRAGAPTEAYVGKADWYAVNLYNSAGIPARPGKIEG